MGDDRLGQNLPDRSKVRPAVDKRREFRRTDNISKSGVSDPLKKHAIDDPRRRPANGDLNEIDDERLTQVTDKVLRNNDRLEDCKLNIERIIIFLRDFKHAEKRSFILYSLDHSDGRHVHRDV